MLVTRAGQALASYARHEQHAVAEADAPPDDRFEVAAQASLAALEPCAEWRADGIRPDMGRISLLDLSCAQCGWSARTAPKHTLHPPASAP